MPPRSYSSKPAPGTGAEEEIISTEGIRFDLDGVTFEAHGQLDAQDFIDLATPLMDANDGWFDPDALAAVGRFYRLVLGQETFRAFTAHRRRHRTPAPVVAQIMTDLIEEISARPPGRRSLSPDGLPPTAASSPAGSPSPGWPAGQPHPAFLSPEQRAQVMTPPGTSYPPRAAAMRSPAGPALDPEGIIPPDWAEAVDVVIAPPRGQVPAAMVPADAAQGTHRTVNLGDLTRTRVEPLGA